MILLPVAVLKLAVAICLNSLLSLSRRSITLINTQLIHQFAFRHADVVNLVLLRAGITLNEMQFTNGLPIDRRAYHSFQWYESEGFFDKS